MRFLRLPSLIFMLACSWSTGVVRAQDAAQYPTWSKLEASPEAKEYAERLKKGEFDAASQAFLERVALPQLAVVGNRKTIERTRKRMREMLLGERVAEAAALDKACGVAVGWLAAQARNKQLEPVVQVNAMLMVGELRGKDGRPWPAAAVVLATAAADPTCPAAVRVAAAAGLARHLDASRAAGGPDEKLAATATKSLLAIIAAAPDGVAGDWLVSRALDMLPSAMPKASPEAVAAVARILEDPARPIDVRVRAATALGAIATAESNIDAARSVTAIRSVAAAALKGDLLTAAERAMSRRMSGQASQTMPSGFAVGMPEFAGAPFPGAEGGFGEAAGFAPAGDPIDPLVVRRDAWRLVTLANAVSDTTGSRGLARLLADPTSATTLAQTLRDAAERLEQMPDAATMKRVLVTLEQAPLAAGAATPPRPAGPPAAEPVEPAANDPFGAPGN